jgi:hypothetical protein
LAQRIGQQAATTVRAKYGWDGVAASFARLCEQARRAQDGKLGQAAVRVRAARAQTGCADLGGSTGEHALVED